MLHVHHMRCSELFSIQFNQASISHSMAQKRSAREACSKPSVPLSAAAALKQAREKAAQPEAEPDSPSLATAVAAAPYDSVIDGEDASSDGEAMVIDAPSSPDRPLSTWRPTKQNVLRSDKEGYEVRLKANDSVTLGGEYDLHVSNGLVTIAGATLHPASGVQRVHALPTQALPAVVARKASTVKFSSVPSSVDCLSHYSPLYRNTGTRDSTGRSFSFLSSSNDDILQRPLAPLDIDNDIRNVISRIVAKATGNGRNRIMAVGGKSTGKSTFNRLLCNTVVTWPEKPNLYYLDLDPGQPEFGPPGQISLVKVTSPLLGPPLTHPASPRSHRFQRIKSHIIAATSFKDDPELYVSCAKELARHIPPTATVIVNSCGWVNGLGATVLLELTTALRITDTVLIQPIDSDLEEAIRRQSQSIHVLPRRQGRLTTHKSPAEHRAMQTMAYLHHKHSSSTDSIKWVDKSINMIRPWKVSYAHESLGVTAVLSYGQAPHPDFLAEVLDGSIVAIVVLDGGYTLEDVHRTVEEQLPYSSVESIDPEWSHCAGIALVRGIDTEEKEVQVVTPLSETEIAGIMDKQIVLVRGAFDSPDWAYTEDLHAAGDAPDDERPWVRQGGQVGIEGAIWRLRHPPTRDQTR
ncbi:Polynucleotide 5'-hydroxyl-kinase grc3 [Fulvia fulva]|nr:Polynucleotide 5'-hydroxyl-kinase grc3 [Fulvia fulva]KAK4613175.1 Polynucleotide 5'-hydroxyl-kinase grc3 [Fulvia fulva]WPV21074.1 Polynucleotide 5'-hydroxyl-kinase grc3 [Fulvia fulva]WPV36276.1 Polynucleotide 5'-hydroxyl-kinase grc3 [Fulvia fulva]